MQIATAICFLWERRRLVVRCTGSTFTMKHLFKTTCARCLATLLNVELGFGFGSHHNDQVRTIQTEGMMVVISPKLLLIIVYWFPKRQDILQECCYAALNRRMGLEVKLSALFTAGIVLFPCKLQIHIQSTDHEDEYGKVHFPEYYFKKLEKEADYLKNIICSDECHFTFSGCVNKSVLPNLGKRTFRRALLDIARKTFDYDLGHRSWKGIIDRGVSENEISTAESYKRMR